MLKIKVDVDGAKELRKKLKMAEEMLSNGMLPAFTAIGSILFINIQKYVPKRSNRLAMSTIPRISPMRAKSIASAVDPTTGYNYARKQHDGGVVGKQWGGHVRGKHYMTKALADTEPEAVAIIEREVARILKAAGLT